MIAKLRHRLVLCSQKDVVDDGTLHLKRAGVMSMWAAIEPKKASTFTPQGAASQENRSTRTHCITTRYHRDIDISNLAWLYEERRKSAPRWFKILSVVQTEKAGSEYFMFDCRLVERSDNAPAPAAESHMPGAAVKTDIVM